MRIIDKKAQKEAFAACFRKPAAKVKVLEPSFTIPKKICTLKIKVNKKTTIKHLKRPVTVYVKVPKGQRVFKHQSTYLAARTPVRKLHAKTDRHMLSAVAKEQ